jgi:hypothetical protein
MRAGTLIRHARHQLYTIIAKLKLDATRPLIRSLTPRCRRSDDERGSVRRRDSCAGPLAWPCDLRGDRCGYAVVVLAGGAAEIGVELARPELGSCERKAHLLLAGVLAAASHHFRCGSPADAMIGRLRLPRTETDAVLHENGPLPWGMPLPLWQAYQGRHGLSFSVVRRLRSPAPGFTTYGNRPGDKTLG